MAGAGRLAIDGGRKSWSKGFPSWPQFDPATDAHVLDILHSGRVNYWTGSVGLRFESDFAKWLGVRQAVTVMNGTAALHLALTALDVGAGDEVVCSPASFVGFSDVLPCGARPVFCDSGRDRLIDPKKIERCVTRQTKAIVVAHLYGMVADMDPILRLAKKRRLFVVEDCAECLGGVYKGRKVGSLGTIGCFSFGPSAQLTSGGDGGMVCCNDDALAEEVRSLRDHGCDLRGKIGLLDDAERRLYVHRRVGYNCRLTEIQSAIGLGELKRFDSWNLPRRRLLGRALVAGLKGHPLVRVPPVDTPARESSFRLVPFVLRREKLVCTVREFREAVSAEGANIHMPACAGTDPEEPVISFWVQPTYAAAHIAADVRAFKKVAAARMR